VTNPSSPKAAAAQSFVDFLQTDPAKAALRKHAVLPYQDGSALASMDGSRRSDILAEVGARASHITPVSAPGATYASRVAVAPTSPDTLAAKMALENRRAEDKETARLTRVNGSVANVTVSSVAYANGSATTVSQANGKDFGKVTAGVSQTGPTTYKVSKGDTLSSIAKRHTVDVNQLREWNHLKNDQIKLGQVLRVSNG
jgi:phosphate transport system substrate-binding protein